MFLQKVKGLLPKQIAFSAHRKEEGRIDVFSPAQSVEKVVVVGGIGHTGSVPISVRLEAVAQQSDISQGSGKPATPDGYGSALGLTAVLH